MAIEEDLYKDLTLEQKIGLLRYERGAHGLVQVDHYDDLRCNPEPTPRPSRLYISAVLGIDFEHFYENTIAEKSKKYREELSAVAVKYPNSGHISWHIGDMISDIIFIKLDIHTTPLPEINEELVNDIDNAIKKLYNTYMELGKSYTYTETDIESDGEKLYRRVLNETEK